MLMHKLGHVPKCNGAWLCLMVIHGTEVHVLLLSLLLFSHSVSLARSYDGTSKWDRVFLCYLSKIFLCHLVIYEMASPCD